VTVPAKLGQIAADRASKLTAYEGSIKDLCDRRNETKTLPAQAGDPTSTGVKYTGSASGNARVRLQFAFAQPGKPYRWGATGPGSFDCSGAAGP
jgi:cell wall-associated NlpC family hydrolase